MNVLIKSYQAPSSCVPHYSPPNLLLCDFIHDTTNSVDPDYSNI